MSVSCRSCGNPVKAFMSFGPQPIANHFLAADDRTPEHFFEMSVGVCAKCTLFQLIEQPAPEMMFHQNYAFFSQSSVGMQKHFEEFARSVMRVLSDTKPFIVEIGSNDGIMLRHFAKAGYHHLGVEPSANVAAVAREGGVDTLNAFFGRETARKIRDDHGNADAILAANVMCHIPALGEIVAGVAELLKPDGLLIFEEPYLGDVIEKTSYDQIYDEHVFLFSVTSVKGAFERAGLTVVDAVHQDTHGGSMRYFVGRAEHHPPTAAVSVFVTKEKRIGLDRPETFAGFRAACERSRDGLVALLGSLKKEGKSVAGYAATSKSTTVLNYCKIGPDLISYICDTTPIKQGKLSPGMHIPIRPYSEFQAKYPDYAVLFAWNHEKEIMAKEGPFIAHGGKWVRFVPKVGIA